MRYFFRRTGLDVLSGRFYGWSREVTNGYGWLWMVIGGNGVVPVNFGWLRVVMGGCGWFWGGNGW